MILLEKSRYHLRIQSVRNVCEKFKDVHLNRFHTRVCQVFTSQKSFKNA